MKRWKIHLTAGVLCMALPLFFTLYLKNQDSGSSWQFADAGEEKLLYLMAAEIPPEYEMETLKMLAVMERTRCRRAELDQTKEPEALTSEELRKRWGSGNYQAYYEKFAEAIISTAGEVITYQGNCIYPEYHFLSAGSTRTMEEVYGRTEFPYLKSVESRQDLEADPYLSVRFVKKTEFQKKCKETWNLPGEQIADIRLDGAGYVWEMTIDGRGVTGEEVQNLLGLPSPCFSIKESGNSYRIVTKGVGHGFGVSLYGANEMAKMGATYRSILSYYYTGIQIQTE